MVCLMLGNEPGGQTLMVLHVYNKFTYKVFLEENSWPSKTPWCYSRGRRVVVRCPSIKGGFGFGSQ